eukprot:1136504-Alexandrium_andersonii.AAC.1
MTAHESAFADAVSGPLRGSISLGCRPSVFADAVSSPLRGSSRGGRWRRSHQRAGVRLSNDCRSL